MGIQILYAHQWNDIITAKFIHYFMHNDSFHYIIFSFSFYFVCWGFIRTYDDEMRWDHPTGESSSGIMPSSVYCRTRIQADARILLLFSVYTIQTTIDRQNTAAHSSDFFLGGYASALSWNILESTHSTVTEFSADGIYVQRRHTRNEGRFFIFMLKHSRKW